MRNSGKRGSARILASGRFLCIRRSVASLLVCLSPGTAFALDPGTLPTGGTVAAGAAAISQAGARLNVQQQSSRAILNWNTFNIGANASVSFQQPASTSVVLNRIASGGGASEIYGSLTANGQVFLVNPAGTLFGRGAQVNVGGLVASSLDITNENFLNGIHRFTGNGAAGSILNQGTLTAAVGGYVALLAPQVRNEGVVAARMGTVAFGAGEAIRLDMGGTGLIEMQVEKAAVDALIANRSLVQADGGVVLMGTRAAGQLAGGVINNTGEIRAARVTERDGMIRLEAGDVSNSGSIIADGTSGGRVALSSDRTTINSGSISARGSQAKGGEVRLLGDKVGLFGTGSVDASGDAGGGTVLVGGNYQGKGPEGNASTTVIDPKARINASATGSGDGGRVIVWAEKLTKFSGTIEARGGPQGGDGGFVETSGKAVLQAFGAVDAGAPKGRGGAWLLDPNNITISVGTDANTTGTFESTDDGAILNNVTLGNALTNGTTVNVTTQSGGANSQDGDIFVQASVTAALTTGQTATLNLVAQRNIEFNPSGNLNGGTGSLNVNLNAGTDVGLTNTAGTLTSAIMMTMGSSIATGGGNVTATANANGITLAGISTGAGTLVVNSKGGAIAQASPLSVAGPASFTAGANSITLTNASNDFGGLVSLSNLGANAVQVTDMNALTLGVLSIPSGNLTAISAGAMSLGSGTLGGNLSASTGGAGAITQTGGLSVGGTTSVVATGNSIALADVANDFSGSVTATGSTVNLKDANSLMAGTITASSGATLSAGGTLNVNSLTAGSGPVSLTATGAAGDIILNSSQSGISAFTANASRDFVRNAGFTTSTGPFNATAGRDILVTAFTTSAGLTSSAMNLIAGRELRLQAGTGTGASAYAYANVAGGAQTVTAGTITLLGGSVGNGNYAGIFGRGPQTVSATSGIVLKGGLSGGVANAGNYAEISTTGNQTVTVGSGGLTATGGGGGPANTDNFARVYQYDNASTQTIIVNNGGSIVLTGGSSGLLNVGGTGHGSRAAVDTTGPSQLINFTAGGAITLTGGSAGSRAFALISSENGSQTITGSPTLSLTGGSGGGVDGEGNYAQIFAKGAQTINAAATVLNGGATGIENSAGIFSDASQTIVTGNLTLNAGAGGLKNSSFIQAPAQDITVHGNLLLTGGGSASSATNGGGAGLGGRGAPNASVTNLVLTVDGDLSLNGGNAGASLGSGFSGGHATDMTIGVGGNVTTDPGSAGVRIGTPSANVAAGNISIIAGGSIALNDTAAAGTAIRTLGNVTLKGASISEGTNGRSSIAASALTTTSTSGATLLNALSVASLNATSSGALGLGQGTISGALVAAANGAVTEAGPLTVGGTASISAGAGPIMLTATNDFQGAVSLSNAGANAIQIADANAIQLGTVSASGDLAVSGVGVTQSGTATVGGVTLVNAGAGPITLGATTNAFAGAISLNNSGANNVTLVNSRSTILGTSNVGSGAFSVTSNGAITGTGAITQAAGAGMTTFIAGANPITLTQANDFTGTVLLSNSGPNAAQITDANTITFTDMTLGGSLTVNAPTIVAHDTTTTGNQLWQGSVTFNSTETTNGGSFTVTGTTTLGNGLTVNSGSGNVNFQGNVNGSNSLVVNSSGFTTFGGTVSSSVRVSVSGASNASTSTTQAVSSVVASTASSLSTGGTSTAATSSSASSSTTSAGAAAAMVAAAGGPAPAPLTAAASSESGTTRLTESSGVSKETIRQIDQQIQQARAQMFSPALDQLAKDPSVADVPECRGAGQAACVKPGKARKPPALAGDSDPVIKRRVALLFGNDRYLAPIPGLQTPIRDVEEVGKVLKEQLGYEVRVVKNASKADIVNELNNVVTEVDEDDSVFVYYAGHGYQAEKDKGGGGFWIPVDANNSDASSWISNTAISKFLANMASRQVMLVSDSCYSGTLAQEQKVSTTENTVFDRNEILRKRSVLVMSSGGNEPVSDGGHDNHSLFAYHLLRNLKSIDGDLVGGDIHERVRTAVMKEYPQNPQYGAVLSAGHSEGGEYLISKK